MRVPNLEKMIEENEPTYHPDFGSNPGYWRCHVCGEIVLPQSISEFHWCKICKYNTRCHGYCKDKLNKVIAYESS